MLIGRVDGIAVQAEAHQNRFQTQFLLKQSHNRDAAAAACGYVKPASRFASQRRKPSWIADTHGIGDSRQNSKY